LEDKGVEHVEDAPASSSELKPAQEESSEEQSSEEVISEPIILSEYSQTEAPVEQDEEKPQESEIIEEKPEVESTPADGMYFWSILFPILHSELRLPR
jgi:hypothetical protein